MNIISKGTSIRRDLFNFIYRISGNGIMTAIRQGLISMMPLMIVGSFAVLINNLPITAFQSFMNETFGESWKNVMGSVYNGTMQIMSVSLLISVSHSISRAQKVVRLRQVSAVTVSLICLGCLITLTRDENNALSFTQLGAMGLFVSVITAISATLLFFFFYNRRMIKIKLFSDAADSMLVQSISALEPAALTFIAFLFVRWGANALGITDIHSFFYDLFKGVFVMLQSGLGAALTFAFSSHLFWFCGLHGNNILENVAQELWVPKLAENMQAVASGGVPTEIFTKQFFDVFVFLGGSGATLGLMIALLVLARRSNSINLTRLSIPLGIFNINETLTYGIPIVFNPFFLIPFLFVPVVLTIITYLAFSLGLVPLVISDVAWTTPIIVGGITATGSIAGGILQVFNLAIASLIYMPFVALSERYKEKVNMSVFRQLNDEIGYVDNRRAPRAIVRNDDVGSLARVLANDLFSAVNSQASDSLFLVFQPQIDNKERVVGVEALIRWKHYKFGFIPPPTLITISEEAELDDALNRWILNSALKELKILNDAGFDNLVMSINLSPLQLRNEDNLAQLEHCIKEYKLDPAMVEIELTENIAFDDSKESRTMMAQLKDMGLRLAIDDFGMGHTSLLYMRSFEVNTIKLDGSLVNDMLDDHSVCEIITAIVNLSKQMNIHVIAEAVELKEQRDKLNELGCNIYQGYYYSKPLTHDDLFEYLRNGR